MVKTTSPENIPEMSKLGIEGANHRSENISSDEQGIFYSSHWALKEEANPLGHLGKKSR